MMEETHTSVTVANCNCERQDSLEVNTETSCNESVSKKERGSHNAETEVMVERVSSTSEQNPLIVHKKLMDSARSVPLDEMPNAKGMSEKYRYKQKHMHSRPPDRDVSKSILSKSSHQSPHDGRDKTYKRQLQGSASQPHTAMKKHNAKEDGRAESEVSSSSYGTDSPTQASRKSSSSNSKSVTKSHHKSHTHAQPLSSDLNSLIERARLAVENHTQDTDKQKRSRQHKGTCKKEKSHVVHNSSPEHKNNIECSKYEEMIERKVREIRNNIEKMCSKAPDDSVSKSRLKDDKRPKERHKELDNQLVPFLPSSRCCSPPSRPTNVIRYWSDAEETEDESDVEKHMMHLNSVNIVLKFLGKNSNEYYVDGKKVSTHNTDNRTMQSKIKQKSIKDRLSYQPLGESWSQSRYSRGYLQEGKNQDRSMSPADQCYPSSSKRGNWSPARKHYGYSSRSRSPVLAVEFSRRDQRSRSQSKHGEFHHRKKSLHSSHNERHYSSRSRSPPGYQETSLRRTDSHSPTWLDHHKYRQSPSPHRRNFQRDSRSRSPWRHRGRPYRDSCSPSRYRGSPPPYYSEDHVRKIGSPCRMWNTEDSLINRRSPSMPNESIYRKQKNSSQSSQRYGTESSHHSEDLYLKEGPKSGYKDHGASGSSELHHRRTDSREQYFSQGSGILRKKGSSTTSRSEHGFSPSSKHLPPLHPDNEVPSHGRHAHGLESPRSGSSEPHTSVIKQDSGLGRPMSRSNVKNVSLRWQQHRREGENKLPLAFGKGAKKTFKLGEASRWERNSLSSTSDHFLSATREDTDEHQKGIGYESEEYQGQRGERHLEKGRTLGSVPNEDTNTSTLVDQENIPAPQNNIVSLDDDEPTIDRPEDYLNTASTVSTYHRPSFVPDALDRQKLELSQSQEDLSLPGPSVITDVLSHGGKKREDPPYWVSDSKYHQEIEDMDSTVPEVSSPSTSQEAIASQEATPDILALSSTLKYISKQVAKKDENEFPTLNSAEMSTLVTLIKLAKERVTTGKSLSTNLSQVLETDDTTNTKMSEPQRDHSENNQHQQPGLSQISAGLQDKAENEATTSKSDTMNKGNIDDDQNVKQGASMTNVSNFTNAKDKKNDFILKRKLDNLSKSYTGSNCIIPKDIKGEFILKRKTDDDLSKSNLKRKTDGDISRSNLKRKTDGDLSKSNLKRKTDGDLSKSNLKRNTDGDLSKSNLKRKTDGDLSKSNLKIITDGDLSKSNFKRKTDDDLSKSNLKRTTDDDLSKFNTGSNYIIPNDKKDDFISKGKSDNLSKSKYDNKHSQSKSKIQRSKKDGKLPKGTKNNEQSLGKNVDQTTSEEKCKEKRHSSKKGDVKEAPSKKKVDHKNEAKVVHKHEAKLVHKHEGKVVHKDKPKVLHKYEGKVVHKDEAKVVHKDKANMVHKDEAKVVHKHEAKVVHKHEGKVVHKYEPKVVHKHEEKLVLKHVGKVVYKNEAKVVHKVKAKMVLKHEGKVVHKNEAKVVHKDEGKVVHKDKSKVVLKHEAKVVHKDEAKVVLKHEAKVVHKDKEKVVHKYEDKVVHKSKAKVVHKDEGKVVHEDEEKRQSKSGNKNTEIEKKFTQIQSVRVDLSASYEIVSSKGKSYKVQGTKILRRPKKKQLKHVGKRIFMNDSSSPKAKKDKSPQADNQIQEVHPLCQETIVLNHSVNLCPACKHSLNPDEFTSISLNTGTITMRCRNCRTYTRMEKVMSLNYYTATSMPKSGAPKATCTALQTSETLGCSVDNSSKNTKKENVMVSSKHEPNENANKKGRSLDPNKQAKKEHKYSSQEVKNVVNEGKVKPSSCKKGIKEKLSFAGFENASKNLPVFKENQWQRDRKKNERSTSFEVNKEEKKSLTEFDSIDPNLCVFPWTSSRKRKTIYCDLKLIEDSSDSDTCNKKRRDKKQHKKIRKGDSST